MIGCMNHIHCTHDYHIRPYALLLRIARVRHRNKRNSLQDICECLEKAFGGEGLFVCSPVQVFSLQKHLKYLAFTQKRHKEYNLEHFILHGSEIKVYKFFIKYNLYRK